MPPKKSVDVLVAAGVVAAFLYARVPSLLEDAARYGWRLFPDVLSFTATALETRVATLSAGLALFFVFWSSGRALARALRLMPASHLESAVTAAALGALLWGQSFFFLGLAGFLGGPFLISLLSLGAIGGLWDAWRHPPNWSGAWRELREAGSPWVGLLTVHLLILAPDAFIPETFHDSLVYHLALPSLYLLRGRIGPVPENAFSGIPSLHEMIYGWALTLDPMGRVAHLLNFGFFVATCVALLALARRLGRSGAGGAAALLFAAAPLACGLSRTTGTEMPWAFWQTAALLAVLDASQAEERAGHWVAAGLVIGAVMSTKNLGWALPVAAFAAAWAASGRRPSGRILAWTGGAAAVMLGPWLIKNFFFYGNPIYPFLHEIIRPHAEIMPGWRVVASEAIPWSSGMAAGLRIWLKTPFESLHPASGDIMQVVNPVMVGLLPISLWFAARERKTRAVVWYAALCWFPLSLATNLVRFFFPVTAVLSLIAAVALEEAPAVMRGLVFAGTACLAVYGWRRGLPLAYQAVFTGQRTDEAFIEHGSLDRYSTPLAAAAHWLDKESPKGARVLLFGDARGFYLTRDYLTATGGQTGALERWSNASAGAAELRARFAAEGIDYILVNHGEMFHQHQVIALTLSGKKTLDEFWGRYTQKAFQAGPEVLVLSDGNQLLDRWVVVYRILSEEEASQPHPSDDLFAAYKTSGSP